jgi:hypothetical protein
MNSLMPGCISPYCAGVRLATRGAKPPRGTHSLKRLDRRGRVMCSCRGDRQDADTTRGDARSGSRAETARTKKEAMRQGKRVIPIPRRFHFRILPSASSSTSARVEDGLVKGWPHQCLLGSMMGISPRWLRHIATSRQMTSPIYPRLLGSMMRVCGMSRHMWTTAGGCASCGRAARCGHRGIWRRRGFRLVRTQRK